MKTVVSLWVLLSVVLVGAPARAQEPEPLVPYDDFDAKLINPDKWIGTHETARILEAIRKTQLEKKKGKGPGGGGRLFLLNRAYGNTDSNTGRRRNVLKLQFADPASVTAIQATVEVNEFEVVGCALNSRPTSARARLIGDFFNTGGIDPVTGDLTPIAGDATNDVFAAIGIRGQSDFPIPTNDLRVRALVFLCDNRRCTSGTVLDSADLGAIGKGKQATLRIEWDGDFVDPVDSEVTGRFIVQRDDEPEVFLKYTVSDAAEAGRPLQGLSIHNFVANCTGEPRPFAFMEALFDDVFVNESAAP